MHFKANHKYNKVTVLQYLGKINIPRPKPHPKLHFLAENYKKTSQKSNTTHKYIKNNGKDYYQQKFNLHDELYNLYWLLLKGKRLLSVKFLSTIHQPYLSAV